MFGPQEASLFCGSLKHVAKYSPPFRSNFPTNSHLSSSERREGLMSDCKIENFYKVKIQSKLIRA